MNIDTTTTTTPSAIPLHTRLDQRERWIAHHEPVDFEAAVDLVMEAHVGDGVRDDVVFSGGLRRIHLAAGY